MSLILREDAVRIFKSKFDNILMTYFRFVINVSQFVSTHKESRIVLTSMLILIVKKYHVLIFVSIEEHETKMKFESMIIDVILNVVKDLYKHDLRCL